MVKNIYDSDIREEIMAKVEMKDTSKKATNTLDRGVMASSRDNVIGLPDCNSADRGFHHKKCGFSGKKGHGKIPNWEQKKAYCLGYNNRCRSCNTMGHL